MLFINVSTFFFPNYSQIVLELFSNYSYLHFSIIKLLRCVEILMCTIIISENRLTNILYFALIFLQKSCFRSHIYYINDIYMSIFFTISYFKCTCIKFYHFLFLYFMTKFFKIFFY